jgi:hypothetical protein
MMKIAVLLEIYTLIFSMGFSPVCCAVECSLAQLRLLCVAFHLALVDTFPARLPTLSAITSNLEAIGVLLDTALIASDRRLWWLLRHGAFPLLDRHTLKRMT